MKYDLISSEEINDLVKMVNSAISDGWVPQGGICVIQTGIAFWFCQAMVKTDGIALST